MLKNVATVFGSEKLGDNLEEVFMPITAREKTFLSLFNSQGEFIIFAIYYQLYLTIIMANEGALSFVLALTLEAK